MGTHARLLGCSGTWPSYAEFLSSSLVVVGCPEHVTYDFFLVYLRFHLMFPLSQEDLHNTNEN